MDESRRLQALQPHAQRIGEGRAHGAGGERVVWDDSDEDVENERRVPEDRSIALEEARRRAIESRVEYRALLMSLTPEQWEAIGLRHADDIDGGHYRGHLEYVAAAREGRESRL